MEGVEGTGGARMGPLPPKGPLLLFRICGLGFGRAA